LTVLLAFSIIAVILVIWINIKFGPKKLHISCGRCHDRFSWKHGETPPQGIFDVEHGMWICVRCLRIREWKQND